MLYSKYSNPIDFINRYIRQGRFGEFVQSFFEAEVKRLKDKAEEDKELKLWIAYVHSYSEEDYISWKNRVAPTNQNAEKNNDFNLDDKGIENIINNLFPQ